MQLLKKGLHITAILFPLALVVVPDHFGGFLPGFLGYQFSAPCGEDTRRAIIRVPTSVPWLVVTRCVVCSPARSSAVCPFVCKRGLPAVSRIDSPSPQRRHQFAHRQLSSAVSVFRDVMAILHCRLLASAQTMTSEERSSDHSETALASSMTLLTRLDQLRPGSD